MRTCRPHLFQQMWVFRLLRVRWSALEGSSGLLFRLSLQLLGENLSQLRRVFNLGVLIRQLHLQLLNVMLPLLQLLLQHPVVMHTALHLILREKKIKIEEKQTHNETSIESVGVAHGKHVSYAGAR